MLKVVSKIVEPNKIIFKRSKKVIVNFAIYISKFAIFISKFAIFISKFAIFISKFAITYFTSRYLKYSRRKKLVLCVYQKYS